MTVQVADDRDFWMKIREARLLEVDQIERLLNRKWPQLPVTRTAELRKQEKNRKQRQ